MKDKKELIRLVKTSEGEIRLDLSGRMNGRGAYICRAPDCMKKALDARVIERSLGAKIPDEVYDMLREELKSIE